MWHVPLVSQQELKGVLPRRQAHFSLRLASTKMQMRKVAWNGLIQRRQFGIDQQVVMSGIFSIGARRCHPHTAKAEADGRFGRQRVAILNVYEVNGSTGRRRRGSTARGGLAMSSSGGRSPD